MGSLCFWNDISYNTICGDNNLSETIQLFTLKVMAKGFGDKDRKYDPTDSKAVKKIKAYITKRIKKKDILYSGKIGQNDLNKDQKLEAQN